MANLNRVIQLGNLTRDPEIKSIGEKTQVANFTLAVSRNFKKQNGEWGKETIFVPCEAWDSGAETLAQQYKKGDQLLVEGALKVDEWEKDGQKHSRMKVRVTNFLGFKPFNKGNDSTTEVGAVESSVDEAFPF